MIVGSESFVLGELFIIFKVLIALLAVVVLGCVFLVGLHVPDRVEGRGTVLVGAFDRFDGLERGHGALSECLCSEM